MSVCKCLSVCLKGTQFVYAASSYLMGCLCLEWTCTASASIAFLGYLLKGFSRSLSLSFFCLCVCVCVILANHASKMTFYWLIYFF